MGNKASKCAESTSESIENYYAMRAVEIAVSEGHEEATVLWSDNAGSADGDPNKSELDEDTHMTNSFNTGGSRHEERGQQVSAPRVRLPAYTAIRNGAVSFTPSDDVTINLTIAIQAARLKPHGVLDFAIQALKKMDVAIVLKEALAWVKAHPWEMAAIVTPLALLACIPTFLGLIGFTASGIAAGSIAASIQAVIGSVTAGSFFATLTSAAMSGFGAPIVYGGVFAISSAVCWGIAAWKKWWKKDDDGDENQHEILSIMGPKLLE